ncbi:MAG: hypothetical protein HPY59_11770 [Anaerolineae bacterium]|nr:hypothetical protein [Anaerolineae bacterium]
MVEQSPAWALTLAYWIHIAATVFWLGGMTTLILFILPLARQYLVGNVYRPFLMKAYSRIQQVGWFCLALLTATGMFQMSSHPSYQGFLAINNPWALAILMKHLVIGLLLLASAYITWILDPKITRLNFLQQDIENEVNYLELRRLEIMKMKMSWFNLILFLVILALTAWARTS